MSAEAKSDLQYEIGQLDRLVHDLVDALADAEPNALYASHLSHLTHSFYNGFEKCLLFILTIRDLPKPSGNEWHRQLIEQFQNELVDVMDTLKDLRGFRHVFRHTYYYELEFDQVKDVAIGIAPVWTTLKPWLESNL